MTDPIRGPSVNHLQGGSSVDSSEKTSKSSADKLRSVVVSLKSWTASSLEGSLYALRKHGTSPRDMSEIKARYHSDFPVKSSGNMTQTVGNRSTAAPAAASVSARQRDIKPMQRPSCLLYTSPSPRDRQKSRMPSSA